MDPQSSIAPPVIPSPVVSPPVIPTVTIPSTEQTITPPITCKYCHLKVSIGDYYCPNCGKKLKNKPVSTGLWALVWLFILSAFFPSLGLGLTIRYIRSADNKSKIIGWISLLITVIAFVGALLAVKVVLETFNQQMNSLLQNNQF